MHIKLSDAYEDLLRLNLRIQSNSTKKHYRVTIRHFGEYLGEVPTTEHLTEDHHSGFARWMMDRGLARVTVNQRLHYMRSLWRHCCRRAHVQIWPTSRDIPEPERQPVAWTDEEMTKIWMAFDQVPGDFFGIPKGPFWRAFHEVIYWTGERKSAVLSSQWNWIRAGRLNIPAEYRKGKRKARSYWLPGSTLDALDAILDPPREKIFPISESSFYNHYHRFLRIAGVDGKRRGPQQMRRTHASFLAREDGDPTKSLGHSTSRVTELYYLDPTVSEGKPPAADLPAPGQRRDRSA